jgi:hypothetical protein
VGNSAVNSTARRAAAPPSSSRVSACNNSSAPNAAAFATSRPAPSGPIPGTASTPRTANGKPGKKAAL